MTDTANDLTVTTTLTPTAPYEFHPALQTLKDSGAHDLLDVLDDGLRWIERPLLLNGRPFVVRLTEATNTPDAPRLLLSVRAPDTTAPPDQHIVDLAAEWATRRFFLDTDMRNVRDVLAVNNYGSELVARFWPLRGANLSSAWEGLLKTVISVQIYPGLAVKLLKGILDFYGTKAQFGGQDRQFYPPPAALAAITPDDLLGLRFSRQKAAYIPGIARAIIEKPERYDFERLRNLPGKEAVAILDELPGVGPWTAHYVAMRGLPHSDVFVDEAKLNQQVAAGLDWREKLAPGEINDLTADFAPYRTFACYYSYMKMYDA